MTVQDGSIDECGTGRYTPPPSYQISSTQNYLDCTASLLNPQNDTPNNTFSNNYETSRISINTKSTAESVQKIYKMLEVKDGIRNILIRIHQKLESQEGVINTFIPVFSFALIIQLAISAANIVIIHYATTYPIKSRFDDYKTVEDLNVSNDDIVYYFNFAKRHVLLDLKKCISQYL